MNGYGFANVCVSVSRGCVGVTPSASCRAVSCRGFVFFCQADSFLLWFVPFTASFQTVFCNNMMKSPIYTLCWACCSARISQYAYFRIPWGFFSALLRSFLTLYAFWGQRASFCMNLFCWSSGILKLVTSILKYIQKNQQVKRFIVT